MRLLVAVLAMLPIALVAAAEKPAAPAGSPHGADGGMGSMHGKTPKRPEITDVKVPKASGPDARTVEEIVTGSDKLKSKTVVVRGTVVRFTPAVLGKNWVHLRDGSGSAAQNTHDVLVTTQDRANVGDIVVARGVVRTDLDLGSGYSYKVVVENATLQK